MRMTKDIFIFDFDGTIGNTLPYIHKVSNMLAKMYGFKHIGESQFQALREKSPVEIIRELNIPLLKIPFVLHKGRQLLKKYMKDVGYVPGMNDVLDTFKKSGKTIGMLTSNSQENIDVFLHRHNLSVFDFVHTENNLFGKQFSLASILKQRNLPKDRTIYVGDEVRDIEACRVLGLDIVSVSWGFSSKEILQKHEPTFLIDTPQELVKLFLEPEHAVTGL